jgi:plasmid stabilization system protein ParE
MRVRVLDEADAEIVEAIQWYDDRRPGLGDEFRKRIATALSQLADNPRRFSRLETVKLPDEIRRVMLDRFPYLLIYKVFAEEVLVIACTHAHRDPCYWVERV